MPSGVIGSLACKHGRFGKYCSIGIWNAIPHFLIWCSWKKRNAWCFEEHESLVLHVNSKLLRRRAAVG